MCYWTASKLENQQVLQLEHDYVVNWQEEDRDDYYAVSGFAHPKLPVITADKEFKKLRWGLIPSWVKDWESASKLRIQTLNAIGDTIHEKPSFRGAVKANRFCIIPVNGFYEWHHHPNKEKYPHFIYPKSDSLFYFGGIYEQWTNPALGEVFNTFSICTTAANPRMEWIHNSKKRMPLILSKENAKIWLDKELAYSHKKELIVPYDESLMADHPISKLITSRKESPNVPAVCEKVEYPELALS